MRWNSIGEEKKGRTVQFRGEGEAMGLEEGWKDRREERAIREGRGDTNEFLFHPEYNNPQKLQR